jgi:hypothetical protein
LSLTALKNGFVKEKDDRKVYDGDLKTYIVMAIARYFEEYLKDHDALTTDKISQKFIDEMIISSPQN